MVDGVLILGATSPIARAAAQTFAKSGYQLFLAGRDESELRKLASDLNIRFSVDVKYGYFDAEKTESHAQFFQNSVQEIEQLKGVLLAVGYHGEQDKGIKDFREMEKIIHSNFIGACTILNECAQYFADKGSGFIIGVSSVAGDRGRQSNYLYGSAKGAFSLYLQGLRNRLYHKGVRVITIKPGFVDTSMTFGKKGVFLVASPDYVGKKIVEALHRSSDIVYLPWFWRYIMLIIKCIPEKIFKRLKL